MKSYNYQYGYSGMHPEMYDIEKREQKAKKIISVLNDYFGKKTKTLSLLDVGCSTGIITNALSEKFGNVVGIDIEKKAINYAKKNNNSNNLRFYAKDIMNSGLSDGSFDVIACVQIYEHVPDPSRLFSEIYRILKPGGICYLSAENRFRIIEGHYKLPFLSIIPKFLAHFYLRIAGKGNFYYENLLTLKKLRKLVFQFEIIDYTLKIIENPQKYCAIEILKPGSFKQKMAKLALKKAYWLCPTYIWLLRKKT